MKAYTDYPDGKMRTVTLTGYDQNKYVQTKEQDEIKRGYIYRTKLKRPYHHNTLIRRLNEV